MDSHMLHWILETVSVQFRIIKVRNRKATREAQAENEEAILAFRLWRSCRAPLKFAHCSPALSCYSFMLGFGYSFFKRYSLGPCTL